MMKVVQTLQARAGTSAPVEVKVYEGDSEAEAIAAIAQVMSLSSPWTRVLSVTLTL